MSGYGHDQPVLVDISAVVPGTIQIKAKDLRVGDKVFDLFGGTHELAMVRTLKSGVVSTRRDDQRYTEHWFPEDTITILRAKENTP